MIHEAVAIMDAQMHANPTMSELLRSARTKAAC
jgi:hypothetical protein